MEIGKIFFNILHFCTISVCSFGKHTVLVAIQFEEFLFSKSSSIICFNSVHSSILILSNCGRHIIIEVEKTISNFSHPTIFIFVRFLKEIEFLRPLKRHVIIGRLSNLMSCNPKSICRSLTSLRQNIFSTLKSCTFSFSKERKCSTFALNSCHK